MKVAYNEKLEIINERMEPKSIILGNNVSYKDRKRLIRLGKKKNCYLRNCSESKHI